MPVSVRIVVASHKKTILPEGPLYLPLRVGAALSADDFGYARDDTGDNISEKNPFFGTQTALYWAWKNLDADYKGLVHYRRFFVSRRREESPVRRALTLEELAPMLESTLVFVPRKRHYVIETVGSHYAHTHSEKHFPVIRQLVGERCPDYLPALDRVLGRRWSYMFNLMILRKDLMDEYCTWLFPVLEAAFTRIYTPDMAPFDARFPGRISEILFNVWLEKQLETGRLRPSQVRELPYFEEVDWGFKIRSFLSAKFLHKKYERSS